MIEETTKYPSYYVIRDGYELQDLLDDCINHLCGTEAVNHGSILKYAVRYGRKDPSIDGKIETYKKIITFATENIKKLEKEKKKEMSSPVMPDEYIDDPLHDED
jgi:hypothetical protein